VDEVQPGDYELSVGVYSAPGTDITYYSGGQSVGLKRIVQGGVHVTVPADPPSGNLDAGVIELKNISDPAP
jgi:hypothetical protein